MAPTKGQIIGELERLKEHIEKCPCCQKREKDIITIENMVSGLILLCPADEDRRKLCLNKVMAAPNDISEAGT